MTARIAIVGAALPGIERAGWRLLADLVTTDTAGRLEQHAADCRARLAALEAGR